MGLPGFPASSASAFVTPVVFAFTAATQFDQIGGRTEGRLVPDLAVALADAVQADWRIMGTATRTRHRLVVLVGVPVQQVEIATGRSGLVAVFGVVASRRPGVPKSLSADALDAIPTVLAGLYPSGGLTASLDVLTHDLQRPDTAIARVTELHRRLDHWTRCLTDLARSAGRRRADRQPVPAPSSEPAVLLAHMLHAQVIRTRRNQRGAVCPIESFDGSEPALGRLSAYQFRGRELYVCHSVKQRKRFRVGA
jgi:hypothetical protein